MNQEIKNLLFEGTVIPAHPLVLHEDLTLDEYKQRRLTRYYMASGAGGIAVGVHTTQFSIRDPKINLLQPVLRLAAEEVESAHLNKPFIKIAGICGATEQAVKEAELAKDFGYHLGLVSLGGLNGFSEDELIRHIEDVAKIIPVFGFYLQPSVGGQILKYSFWRRMADIPNVMAIKTAPFNRYQTLDVARAVCSSSRRNEIALYTGNDDNIVADLLTRYRFNIDGKIVEKGFSGGLLGHWAVWTKKAVSLLKEVKLADREHADSLLELLIKGTSVTDMNSAIFDPVHKFRGSIAGIHEVLRRQGLMQGIWCLDPAERLSEGQLEEIERVVTAYPELVDDEFVKEFLEADGKNY